MTFRRIFLKVAVALIYSLLTLPIANAQKKHLFSFVLPKYKVEHSLYNKIQFVDNRADTSELGRILTGASGKQAMVVPKEPLQVQINSVLSALTDATAGQGELLLNLRHLSFFEQSDGSDVKGSFFIRAEMYAKTDGAYKLLSKIDSSFRVSASDGELLLENGGNVLTYYIGKNLTIAARGDSYTFNDVIGIDSIEKRNMKLFTTSAFVDGYYANYNSFKEQIPESTITVLGDTIRSNNVSAYDTKGKLKKIKPSVTYAIVFKGKAYIGTKDGYAPVEKTNNHLIFISKAGGLNNTSNNMVVMMGAGVIGGAVGVLATALVTSKTRYFNTLIDHLSGKFVLLNEVPDKNY